MAKPTRIKWNKAAFRQMRETDGVRRELNHLVDRALDITGREHYAGGVEQGRNRLRGYVVTADGEGVRDQADQHSLQTAIANLEGYRD